MAKEKTDFIQKKLEMKKIMALLTSFFMDAFSASNLVKLFVSFRISV